jgi:putative transposase
MNDHQWQSEREKAIHLLRSGLTVTQVSQEMGRSSSWVSKWKTRYATQGWAGLVSQSRAPKHSPHEYDEETRQMIGQIRSELEAEGAKGQGLCYVGAPTIRARLQQRLPAGTAIPRTATIERVLHDAGMTRPKQDPAKAVAYPRLHPTAPHQVHQIDIVPHHFSKDPQAVDCFNGLDVVSRYPTGHTYAHKSSQDAARFLLKLWRELGIATYTQMDNESCFCGGHTHPYVLGKVVRLCLLVGTQPIFIPIRHPKSNGAVERFHQAYDKHVWEAHYLADLTTVNFHGDAFFAAYRASHYPSALGGRTPQQTHQAYPQRGLPREFIPDLKALPITEGQIHFIRKVEADGAVPILNARWPVSDSQVGQGVWTTLTLSTGKTNAELAVYTDAPDALSRHRLITHPFPIPGPVVPLSPDFRPTVAQPFLYKALRVVQKAFTML